MKNSRERAADIIGRWITTGDFPDRLIEGVDRDRAFVMEVVFGVVRWKKTLDWVIAKYSSRPNKRLVPFLYTGLYQLLLMDNVAEYAAVNETVEAAKRISRSAGGFVNAILRRAQTGKTGLLAELAGQPLPVRESHPEILVDRWTGRYGADGAEKLCKWNNTRPKVQIRISGLKPQLVPPEFKDKDFVELPPGTRVEDVPGYAEGSFIVQDPSTAHAVKLLDPKPGETVLDACAAPGGKTVMIAERMRLQGELYAADIHADRIVTLKDTLNRMKCGWVKVIKADSSRLQKVTGDKIFDAILLDAPCTNTGVIRRRPDARWRFSLKRLKELTHLQKSLLDSASKVLKPGGRIVYSTCSLEPEENSSLVAGWLGQNTGFKMEKQVEIFPPKAGTDGAFAALIRKLE